MDMQFITSPSHGAVRNMWVFSSFSACKKVTSIADNYSRTHTNTHTVSYTLLAKLYPFEPFIRTYPFVQYTSLAKGKFIVKKN